MPVRQRRHPSELHRFSLITRWRRLAALVGLAAAAAVTGGAGCSSSDEPPASAGAVSPEAQLEKGTGVPWVVDVDPRRGSPDLAMPLSGMAPILRAGEAHESAALRFLEEYKGAFAIDSAAAQLSMTDKDIEPDGLAHVRFAQVERGVPIFGGGYDVHFTSTGAIAYVGGDYVSGLGSASIAPGIDEPAAVAAAEKDLVASQPSARIDSRTARLAFLPRADAGASLAYEVVLAGDAGDAPFATRVFVDAKQGAVIERFELVMSETAIGRGVKSFPPISKPGVTTNDTKQITVRQTASGPELEMVRASGGLPISTVRFGQTSPIVGAGGTKWDPRPAGWNGEGAAVDAHFHMAVVDEWFRTTLGWHGYDNHDSGITLIVHDNSHGNENAFWDGSGRLHFGDGTANSGGNWLPSVGLETMGHEFMHGVTQYTSGLVYRDQSGALNESFSDVFGASLYHDKRSDHDALLLFAEESLNGSALRDMLHPGKQGQPDHFTNRVHGCDPAGPCGSAQDFGGVHANSGIPNNAFALMAVGGTQDTSKIEVAGFGWENARRIWWSSARYDARNHSDFSKVARWQMAAAKVRGMNVEPVGCAWVAVGVVDAKYAKTSFHVTCAKADAGAPAARAVDDCALDAEDSCATRFPGRSAICSFNGDRSCCKEPFPITEVCYSSADCSGGDVCALGTDTTDGASAQFTCTHKDEHACLDDGSAGGAR